MNRHRKQILVACALLATATLAVFWPITHGDFISFDDPQYVTENSVVLQGLTWHGIAWAFGSGYAANWHPITWLSHMLDVQLFGLRPAAHHLVSVSFHIANTLVLFLLLDKLTDRLWRSAFVAALFALHPLHIESVAWIAERKDVLSAFFGLLSISAYAMYVVQSKVERPKSEVKGGPATQPATRPTQRSSRLTSYGSLFYFLSLLLFALSILSKAMLVTLPFLLLLLDYWPLARCQVKNRDSRLKAVLPLVWEKTPFFALAAASSAITFLVQRQAGTVAAIDRLSLAGRLCNCALGYGLYLQKAFWPARLAVFYPLSPEQVGWHVAAAALLFAAVSAGVLLARRRHWLPVGWFWFVGMLVPVLGLVQVGDASIANRYTYLPLVGLFILVAWGLAEVSGSWPLRQPALALGAGVLLLACSVLSRRELLYWRDSGTLFRRALAVTENNYVACDNLGFYLCSIGQIDEAIESYRKSLAIRVKFESLNNLGLALATKGKPDEAIGYYRAALRIRPNEAGARKNLARALTQTGQLTEAIDQYQIVLRINPGDFQSRNDLGLAFTAQGRLDEAIGQFREVLRTDPKQAEACANLAEALAQSGQLDEAIAEYQTLLRSTPTNVQARNNLGITLTMNGKLDEAVAQFRIILRADPNQAGTHGNLAYVLATQHMLAEAIEQYREVLRLSPSDPRAHQGLGSVLTEQGRLEEAVGEFTTALRLSPDNPALHYQLGLALERQGKREEAAARYTEAVRLKPDYLEARRQLESLSSPPKR